MQIKVGQYIIMDYNEVTVSLRYDSIADTFSFVLYFDPNNDIHKVIFKPASYQNCTISHLNGNGQNEIVIVGTLLSPLFSSSAKKELSSISGYSKTGILADCCVFSGQITAGSDNATPFAVQIINANGSLQFNNVSLKDIATRILSYYGLGDFVIDLNVQTECDKIFTQTSADPSETVEDFLSNLCSQRDIVLSHTIDGKVLFTKSKSIKNITNVAIMEYAQQVPRSTFIAGAPDLILVPGNKSVSLSAKSVYHFQPGQTIWTRMDFPLNAQKMHSFIQLVGQQGNTNSPDDTQSNPYVGNIFRYTRKVQTSGDDNDTKLTARNVLSQELKAFPLTIEMVGWELGGQLVRPNTIITVTNPELYLYKETRFFIESVEFKGNTKSETCTLTCVFPECYNDEDVKNIFE